MVRTCTLLKFTPTYGSKAQVSSSGSTVTPYSKVQPPFYEECISYRLVPPCYYLTVFFLVHRSSSSVFIGYNSDTGIPLRVHVYERNVIALSYPKHLKITISPPMIIRIAAYKQPTAHLIG